MLTLALTAMSLSSIMADIETLKRDSNALAQAISGLSSATSGRRRSMITIELDGILSEGNLLQASNLGLQLT
jgi:hypothetical protein